jgi:hypothetical protein
MNLRESVTLAVAVVVAFAVGTAAVLAISYLLEVIR